MIKVTLAIPEKKYPFFIDLVNNLGFVKKIPDNDEPTKQQILQDLEAAVEEVNLIKAGKLKGIPAKDIINEL